MQAAARGLSRGRGDDRRRHLQGRRGGGATRGRFSGSEISGTSDSMIRDRSIELCGPGEPACSERAKGTTLALLQSTADAERSGSARAAFFWSASQWCGRRMPADRLSLTLLKTASVSIWLSRSIGLVGFSPVGIGHAAFPVSPLPVPSHTVSWSVQNTHASV